MRFVKTCDVCQRNNDVDAALHPIPVKSNFVTRYITVDFLVTVYLNDVFP